MVAQEDLHVPRRLQVVDLEGSGVCERVGDGALKRRQPDLGVGMAYERDELHPVMSARW